MPEDNSKLNSLEHSNSPVPENSSHANHSHWFLLRLAIVFLTRWPIAIKEKVDDTAINASTGYFALVGLLIGGLSVGVYLLASLVLPSSIAVVLSMVASIVFTGAFHEDGLADTADGLGGGWTVESKLNIMKDSRIGTYGASALLLALLLKYTALTELAQLSGLSVCFALLMGHSLSRACAASIIGKLNYVQLDKLSKTKPVAQSLSQQSRRVLLATTVTVFVIAGLSPLISLQDIAILLALLWFVRALFIRFMARQLGGYTGDVLGAAQQAFELSLYLVLLAIIQ